MSEGEAALDVLIVGAGLAGMYALHRFRGAGYRVQVLEAGGGVGGTWYWNRYPGARCDVPSLEYSYSWDPELEQQWEWTELMAAQPEILRYAEHVADRHDLRRDIRFHTRVAAAHWDDGARTWQVRSEAGERWSARHLVMATGCLSVPMTPELPGADRYAGEVLHTGRWPHHPVDFSGRRVAILGTGSSAVQAIPVIAQTAAELLVIQRTPVYTFPAGNRPMRADVQQYIKANYPEVRRLQRLSPVGYSGFGPPGAASAVNRPEPIDARLLDLSPDERLALVEREGLGVLRRFNEVYRDLEANEAACEVYRQAIRRRIRDPDKAEGLLPRGYPIGCKRPVIDTDFYAAFNRANVRLVDLRREPLETFTPTGLRTARGDYAFDMFIYATGFDAMTGALTRVDIRGRDGVALKDKWRDGPETLLGLQTAGFPNLFTVTGPGSPSVLSNVIVSIEQHVDWIFDCIGQLRASGFTTIEAQRDAELAWTRHVAEVAEGTMLAAESCNSWYLGSNVPGKPRIFLPYVGGVGRYRQRCEAVVAAGYEGFTRA